MSQIFILFYFFLAEFQIFIAFLASLPQMYGFLTWDSWVTGFTILFVSFGVYEIPSVAACS